MRSDHGGHGTWRPGHCSAHSRKCRRHQTHGIELKAQQLGIGLTLGQDNGLLFSSPEEFVQQAAALLKGWFKCCPMIIRPDPLQTPRFEKNALQAGYPTQLGTFMNQCQSESIVHFPRGYSVEAEGRAYAGLVRKLVQ